MATLSLTPATGRTTTTPRVRRAEGVFFRPYFVSVMLAMAENLVTLNLARSLNLCSLQGTLSRTCSTTYVDSVSLPILGTSAQSPKCVGDH